MPKNYRPLHTITYSRKIKALRAGKPRWLHAHGKRVKVLLEPDGRRLRVLEAPPDVLSEIRRAEAVSIRDGRLSIEGAVAPARTRTPSPQPRPKSKPQPVFAPPPPPLPSPPSVPQIHPTTPPDTAPTPQKTEQPLPAADDYMPTPLSDEDREQAVYLPVPANGPVPNLVDWSHLPPVAHPFNHRSPPFLDSPQRGAPNGVIPFLREAFRRNRTGALKGMPVNIWIQGSPGVGKTHAVVKFAEEAGLPYWSAIGEDMMVEQLLGHKELVTTPEGQKTVFVEGIIPKAVRHGGVLHFDEANVMPAEVLLRLNELFDHRRQLTMKETNEVINAHPDLFLVVTTNPATFEGLKDIPDSLVNRLNQAIQMAPLPEHVEMQALNAKLRALDGFTDAEFKPPKKEGEVATGKYAKDIADFMSVVTHLRKQTSSDRIKYPPSMRDAEAFARAIKEGDKFHDAFDRVITNKYSDEAEIAKVNEALHSVGRARQ